MPNDLLTPFLDDTNTRAMLAALGKTAPPVKRPDLEALYAKLATASEQPPDYSGVQRVAASRADKSNADLATGLGMQMFGGKTMSPTGRQITANAVEQGNPLRANASDVGYYDPQSGEFVENPAMRQGRTEKALLAQIAGGERALSAEQARELQRDKTAAELALRAAIAGQRNITNIHLGDQRAASRGDRVSAAGMRDQADVAKGLNAVDLALEGVRNTPSAFGKVRGIPGGVLGQFGESVAGTFDTDEETTARAAVFNVMSSLIKERAGTAQSQHELRTLNGFLPSPYDNATQVENKLIGFQKFLQGQGEASAQTYGGRSVSGKIGAPKLTVPAPSKPTVKFGDMK